MKAGRVLLLFSLSWALSCLPSFAAIPVTVQNLRMWRAPDNTRLVFDLSGSVEHQVFVLQGPDRIVVDLNNALFRGDLPQVDPENALLASIRSGRPESSTLRFVLDLKRAVKPRSFVLKPIGQYGHRLVIDLIDPQATEEEGTAEEEESTESSQNSAPTPAPAIPRAKHEWVIAIDAGHGGEDPGALGRSYRTREKDVTLAVARELARLVDREPEMKSALIRKGDYFIKLRQRHLIAKKHQADIFVSIHADALPGRRIAYGSSVYALSERGATHSLAQALADQENYSDLIGGVDLSDKPSDVRRTLLDLSQEKTVEHSLQLGEDVLSELRHLGRVHRSKVGQANFAVLRTPEVPSVLVETAFISTPQEEKKLRDRGYQRQLAAAILKGVKKFIARNGDARPPPQQQVVTNSPREHVVRAGDTLVSIARRYDTSVEVLRFLNELSGDDLSIGAHLRLPLAQGI